MIDGKIEKQIINGKVFVNFDDLVQGLFTAINQSLDLVEITGDQHLLVQTTGLIELAQGLDDVLDSIKQRYGLARFR